MIRFSPSHLITVDAAAAGETPRRSISGVAVEWNQVAIVSSGEKVMFMPGSLPVDGRRPKLYMQHNAEKIIGQVTERIDTGEALMFTASISQTDLGNEALTLMSDGTLNEVSVGVDVIKFHYNKQPDQSEIISLNEDSNKYLSENYTIEKEQEKILALLQKASTDTIKTFSRAKLDKDFFIAVMKVASENRGITSIENEQEFQKAFGKALKEVNTSLEINKYNLDYQ